MNLKFSKWFALIDFNYIIHGRFLPPPPEFFLSPHSDMSHQHHFKKKLSPSNPMLISYKLWISPCLRNDLPFRNLWGGNILLLKITIKCPAGQNLEIMIFRYLKTLVYDKFFKNLKHYLMFLISEEYY